MHTTFPRLSVPDFAIIGAGKSGTTALHKYLQQHPQIFIPEHKDPSYLAVMDERPTPPEDDPENLQYHPYAIYEAAAYQALFDPAAPGQLTGDVSTMYMYHPQAAANICRYRPDIKIIAILRNPAERLYSRYLHLARDGRQHETPLEQLFEPESIWWRRNDLIYEGLFYQHLKRYYDRFEPEQIKVFLYDDLKADEAGLIRQIFDFLGVEREVQPETDIRFNQSGIVKHAWKDYLIGHRSILRRSAEAVSPGLVQRMREHPRLQRLVSQMRAKNLERPPLNPELRERIINEIYKQDLLELQSLIGRDLSHWLEKQPR